MAADVSIIEVNGTEGVEEATPKAGETVRFKSADDSEVDNNDPLVKPNAGVYRSYEKYLRTVLNDLDESDSISNIEVFATGSANTGLAILAKTEEDYATPVRTAMAGDKANIFTYTTNSPLVLGEGPFDTAGDAEGIGLFLVLQMEVYPSATTGTMDAFNLVLRYDEE